MSRSGSKLYCNTKNERHYTATITDEYALENWKLQFLTLCMLLSNSAVRNSWKTKQQACTCTTLKYGACSNKQSLTSPRFNKLCPGPEASFGPVPTDFTSTQVRFTHMYSHLRHFWLSYNFTVRRSTQQAELKRKKEQKINLRLPSLGATAKYHMNKRARPE